MAASHGSQVWATCAANPALLRMYIRARYMVQLLTSTAFREGGAMEFQLVLHPRPTGSGASGTSDSLSYTAHCTSFAGKAALNP